ncbi:Hydrogenase maturation factor HypB [subsurface metagenome]
MSDKEEREIQRFMELDSNKLTKGKERELAIQIEEDIMKQNEILADQINQEFKKHNIKSVDIVGAIGAGKTAIIEKILEKLGSKYRILVICGDVTTRVDANRIEKHNAESIQINTGRECALNAYHINQIIKNKDLNNYDLIFIENVGNLICPSDFVLGTDKRITIVSITEGEWVIEKHPMLFKMSDIAVINKIDLAEILETNIDKMISDAKKINPNIQVITTSAKTGENINKLIEIIGLGK